MDWDAICEDAGKDFEEPSLKPCGGSLRKLEEEFPAETSVVDETLLFWLSELDDAAMADAVEDPSSCDGETIRLEDAEVCADERV